MTSPARRPKLPILIFLSAVSIVPISIFLPSLPHIAQEFGVSYAMVSISLAGYAAVSASLQLILAPLSDRVGRRPVILAGIAIFIAASIGCALADDLWVFLVFRLAQAAIAPVYAVALASIRDTTAKQQAASLIGYIAMAWAAAPMLGPTLGGVLDEAFGWRSIFWGLALTGIALWVLCWRGLNETNFDRSKSILEQFRSYPALLGTPRFWAYALCSMFSVGTFYAFLTGAPLVASMAFNLPSTAVGMTMGSMTAGFILGSFLSGRYASRFALTATMGAGRLVAVAGPLIALALSFAGIDHAIAFFAPCVLAGMGNGLALPSANSGAMSIRPDLAGSAAGLGSAITVLGAAILSSITGAALAGTAATNTLLGVMLLTTLASLGAAFWAHRLETAI